MVTLCFLFSFLSVSGQSSIQLSIASWKNLSNYFLSFCCKISLVSDPKDCNSFLASIPEPCTLDPHKYVFNIHSRFMVENWSCPFSAYLIGFDFSRRKESSNWATLRDIHRWVDFKNSLAWSSISNEPTITRFFYPLKNRGRLFTNSKTLVYCCRM